MCVILRCASKIKYAPGNKILFCTEVMSAVILCRGFPPLFFPGDRGGWCCGGRRCFCDEPKICAGCRLSRWSNANGRHVGSRWTGASSFKVGKVQLERRLRAKIAPEINLGREGTREIPWCEDKYPFQSKHVGIGYFWITQRVRERV